MIDETTTDLCPRCGAAVQFYRLDDYQPAMDSHQFPALRIQKTGYFRIVSHCKRCGKSDYSDLFPSQKLIEQRQKSIEILYKSLKV